MKRADRVWMGIDPGASGGVSVLYDNGQSLVLPMPKGRTELAQLLVDLTQKVPALVVIEKVGGYVKGSADGESGGEQPGSRAFKFGMNYGMLLGMLEMMSELTKDVLSVEEVTPQLWQRRLGILPRIKGRRKVGKGKAADIRAEGGESKEDFKRRLKKIAEKMYPGVKLTLKTCDSLLIAHYCKLTNGG